jgi:hypothetical protein
MRAPFFIFHAEAQRSRRNLLTVPNWKVFSASPAPLRETRLLLQV